jgi:hypothetical protein
MSNIYLAGPMRGIPNFNTPAFTEGAARLRSQGHTVFNPAERDMEEFGTVSESAGDEHAFAKKVGLTTDALRRNCFLADTQWICKHANAIALLPGWENSKGAMAERALGLALGLEIILL